MPRDVINLCMFSLFETIMLRMLSEMSSTVVELPNIN